MLPYLKVDHPAINYFIARSVLKLPYDEPIFSWMRKDGVIDGPDYLVADDFKSVIPVIPADTRIKFRSDKQNRSTAQRMTDVSWWPIERDHVWASKSPANLKFKSAQDPRSLIIFLVPYLLDGIKDRSFEVYMNDVKLPDIYADRMDWSNPVEYKVDIPAEAIRDDKQVHI
ncbi:hypothetical protein GCM10009425_38420 [Pseudomonas asuensis]|uniref:Uncharacterized protein n=2 Tax=Pseudomonas asuensis TaxID=1825787 RepID=A0ABQ2H0U9_9PSED|nr:hypothetical protein GCM10009425_38420 [Pseudomonas asuensis]